MGRVSPSTGSRSPEGSHGSLGSSRLVCMISVPSVEKVNLREGIAGRTLYGSGVVAQTHVKDGIGCMEMSWIIFASSSVEESQMGEKVLHWGFLVTALLDLT